jgi:cytidine deaminase
VEPIRRKELSPALAAALLAAEAALDRSHCPHSGLSVAAALTIEGGAPLTGVNYESASYGLTLCAERAAIARARAEGLDDRITGLVLAVRWPAQAGAGGPLTPCGACRQWLAELAQRLGRQLPVQSFAEGGEDGFRTSSSELLPAAFNMDPR